MVQSRESLSELWICDGKCKNIELITYILGTLAHPPLTTLPLGAGCTTDPPLQLPFVGLFLSISVTLLSSPVFSTEEEGGTGTSSPLSWLLAVSNRPNSRVRAFSAFPLEPGLPQELFERLLPLVTGVKCSGESSPSTVVAVTEFSLVTVAVLGVLSTGDTQLGMGEMKPEEGLLESLWLFLRLLLRREPPDAVVRGDIRSWYDGVLKDNMNVNKLYRKMYHSYMHKATPVKYM